MTSNGRHGQVGLILLLAAMLIILTAVFLTLTPKPRAEVVRTTLLPQSLKVCMETAFEKAIRDTLLAGGSIIPADAPLIVRAYYTLTTPEGDVFTILHSAPLSLLYTKGMPIRQAPVIPPLEGMLRGPPALPGVNESIALRWKYYAQEDEANGGCAVLVTSMSIHVTDTAAEGRITFTSNKTPLSMRVSRSYPFGDVRNALIAFGLLNTGNTHITLPQRDGLTFTFTPNDATSLLIRERRHGIITITPQYGRLPYLDEIPSWRAGVEDQLPLIEDASCESLQSLTPPLTNPRSSPILDPDGDVITRIQLNGCQKTQNAERIILTMEDTASTGQSTTYTVTYDFTMGKVIVS